MHAPLLATADPALLDDLRRLAAAAGVDAESAPDAVAALRRWTGPPLVLVGADLAGELAHLGPARRAGVHVVTWGTPGEPDYRAAVGVGAESVLGLPQAEHRVTEVLSDVGEAGPAPGVVLGLLGGSGGAGATTFACALGQVAARTGRALVVDADPLGPGVDRVLGLDGCEGFRWDALCRTTGRLGGRALREALPRRGGLGVLGWYAGASEPLQPGAVREVLSAARRGHDAVVVDLPRSVDGPPGSATDEVLARCDQVVVVVRPTVAGVSSAARLCARLPDRDRVRLVVRGRGVPPAEVAGVCGVPVVATVADQRGLHESIDLGLGPVRSPRCHLGRAAETVLARIAVLGVAA
ncbi:septum site-determining protein Ssd [Nocardioides marmotae]|uniref:septum site-determining protein Ssd n=1 Tax=Nocardioides marmotae TaxID=2663857 RepID=UPI001328CBD0|nr:septum site-determining protein Ssd [Nocardioides marmotae]MBC9734199.1 septum site determining protein [Nocardioides marmotae]MTB85302.1 septum site determining protein [Nocardioides marmotae]